MTGFELRVALALAAIFALRMLGLFMVLPVLSLYAERLVAATPFLIGVALGVYGLTQAILQIPMGYLSDRWGRKPIIALGLLLFAAGGVIAALSDHIFAVITGRALQGAGAISGAALALAADAARPQQRTKVMAIIGVSIGLAFSAAFLLGPIVDAWLGLSGLFWLTAVFAVLALPLLVFAVPSTSQVQYRAAVSAATAATSPAALRRLQVAVFALHFILAASFVSIPRLLGDDLGLSSALHYTIYIPTLVISLLLVGPLIGYSSRKNLATRFFPLAIAALTLAEGLLWWIPPQQELVITVLALFFVGFNYLEAALPSLVSRLAPTAGKGAALGAYSTSQFLGAFAGGTCGGVIAQAFDYRSVFLVAFLLGCAWLTTSLRLPQPDAPPAVR